MKLRRLSTADSGFSAELEGLLDWQQTNESAVPDIVHDILLTVRREGDEALLRYTEQFDGMAIAQADALRIDDAALNAAYERIKSQDRTALHQAADRIRQYHEHQRESSWSFTDDLGNRLGQKITPIERVGVYVPGGQASYPSSVLMTLVPAKVAGVNELVVTVPTPQGERNDLVLAALKVAEADLVFTVGGAQAVAALAYGTAAIPRVDKIVGPGGAFVAEAKRQVFGHVGIDVIAGPSEILVIADGTTPAEWVALDLFSQAEHDAVAQALLISPNADYLDEVAAVMSQSLPKFERRDTIAASMAGRGALIHCADLNEAVSLANRIAPEHLELQVADPDVLLDQIKHAGAIFCGAYAGETLGDYAAGPSHVLPTFGTARFASPLGVYDFVKRSSVMHISAQGAATLADVAVPMATREGLQAHAAAAAVRVSNKA